MQTRSFPRIVAVASILLSHAFAGEGWLVDFEKAKLTAKTESKDILMDFTGSDWCGWCIKLRDEVFTKDEFKSAAPQKFVLLELDFPQSPEIKGKMKPEMKGKAVPPKGKAVPPKGKAGATDKQAAAQNKFKEMIAKKKEAAAKKK